MDIFILVLSLVAGVVGTGVGGVIGALFADRGDAVTGKVLSFAGGVMAGIVGFEMLPQAFSTTSGTPLSFAILAFVVLGILSVFALQKLISYLENKQSKRLNFSDYQNSSPHSKNKRPKQTYSFGSSQIQSISPQNDKNRQSNQTVYHNADLSNCKDVAASCAAFGGGAFALAVANKGKLLSAGILMLVAIALHNFPEGMAIGAAGASQTSLGVIMAIVIAVHNIPEGMAIGAPLTGGGVKPLYAVLLSALAGFATVLGALIGLLLGTLGQFALAASMAAAGGAMLYVTFGSLFPQSVKLTGKFPSASCLSGVLVSALFVFCAM